MDWSPKLDLPYILSGQAQKHVTHNEAISLIDCLVQMTVKSADTATQPEHVSEGDMYILPDQMTGSKWEHMSPASLAVYTGGAWKEIIPKIGWICAVVDTSSLLMFSSEGWQSVEHNSAGLGSAAYKDIGISGDTIPKLDMPAAWSADHSFEGYRNVSFLTGNSKGIVSGRYNIDSTASDHFTLSCNYDLGQNTSVHSLLGSAMLEVCATNGADGFIGFWAGGPASTPQRRVAVNSQALFPVSDGQYNLGQPAYRYQDIYSVNGVSMTSDAREKTDLVKLTPEERRSIAQIMTEVGSFSWLKDVESVGEEAAQIHIGITAQNVAKAFINEGLDPQDYALWQEDVFENGETRMGLRPVQLLLMSMGTLFQEIEELKQRNQQV